MKILQLHWIDWVIVFVYLLATILIGIYFSRRAKKSIADYFVAGRNLPWWLLGTSMVATTFSSDTPLAVSGLVIKQGIAGNWYWWAGGITGMLGVFFYARLWRRAEVVTDTELIELRYSGKPAAFLRGFRALYFSLPYNCIVMGWVNLSMAKIMEEVLGLPKLISVSILFMITVIYTSMSGLWGVVATDLVQFIIALSGAILLAVISLTQSGGLHHIIYKLTEVYGIERTQAMVNFFPSFIDVTLLPVSFFLIYLGLQWWSTGNTDGGGYFAQRMLAAKDETHAQLGFLWGNIAHYCLRSWPWIIVGLVAAAKYYQFNPVNGQVIDLATGEVADPERGYIRVMLDFLPTGLLGLMLASFLAAYMSTIDTQLNWGSSYLINDFYKRFINKTATAEHYVKASVIGTIFIAVCGAGVTMLMSSIVAAWQLLTAVASGVGIVYLLRWYWWRVNAWSELTALLSSLIVSTLLFTFTQIKFPISLLYSVPISISLSFLVTMLTKPVDENKLVEFYLRVQPTGPGWKNIQYKLSLPQPKEHTFKYNFYCWLLSTLAVYTAMFGIGKLIFNQHLTGWLLLCVSLLSFYLVYYWLKK